MPKDPAKPIVDRARRFPDVEEGTSCTQSSFKVGKNAFLYIGMQGGRHKAMFKLAESMPEAVERAKREPDRFQAGSTAWVTARFTAEEPLPKALWHKWLEESYALSRGAGTSKKAAGEKKAAKKKVAKKKAGKARKKAARRRRA